MHSPLLNSVRFVDDNESPRVRGFTLVELLIVISVVAILAALSLAVVGKIRSKADDVTAINQLRQLGTVFQQYAGENNGRLTFGGMNNNTSWDMILVNSGVTDLATLRQILHSPAHESTREYPRSYAMTRTNYTKGIGVDNNNATEPVSLFAIGKPSETLLLSEKFEKNNAVGSYSNCLIDSPQQSINLAPDRKICNYLFVDGHVESLSPDQTIGKKGTLSKPQGYWTVDPTD